MKIQHIQSLHGLGRDGPEDAMALVRLSFLYNIRTLTNGDMLALKEVDKTGGLYEY